MPYYDPQADVTVGYRKHHDWILPKRVLVSIFVTGVVLEVLGAVLLIIGSAHPANVSSFNASGAVLLGLGACLHAILLLFCCHAFCVIYTKDKHTQTQEGDGTVVESGKPESGVFGEKNLPQVENYVSSSPTRRSFGTALRQSPVRQYVSPHQATYSTLPANQSEEPLLRSQESALNASGEAKLPAPTYAVVNKPPSAMKKSQYEKNFAERKRVRMSPDIGDSAQISRYDDVSMLNQTTEQKSEETPPFPRQIKLESRSEELYTAQKLIPSQSAIETTSISIESGPKNLYYPEDKYASHAKAEDVIDGKYRAIEYSSVRYSPDLHQPVIHQSTLDHPQTARTVYAPPVRSQDDSYSQNVSVTSVGIPYDDPYHGDIEPGVLLRASQRRPMTFEEFSASKMSVYDNLSGGNWNTKQSYLV